MKAKVSGFAIYVEAIIFLLLYNLHDCTFKSGSHYSFALKKKVSNQERSMITVRLNLYIY